MTPQKKPLVDIQRLLRHPLFVQAACGLAGLYAGWMVWMTASIYGLKEDVGVLLRTENIKHEAANPDVAEGLRSPRYSRTN